MFRFCLTPPGVLQRTLNMPEDQPKSSIKAKDALIRIAHRMDCLTDFSLYHKIYKMMPVLG